MPGGRGLFSPPGGASVPRVAHTPQDYISPSARRHRNVTGSPSVSHVVSTLLTTPSINDDEAEKRERRRSKVLELQRRNITSPATPSTSRRQSLPLGGLSNVQVTEHYSSCIKLSAENKINAKNAFGLHLIDYMSELLKKKEMNNFQVASSTLDASAKIYAGRVDAIHSETYKVLSGLGRGAEKSNTEGDDHMAEDGTTDNDPAHVKDPKRKRTRKSNTIETNLKSLNVNKFDLEFEVDPLFSKTSAAFDEGGTGGLLLNHLRCLDDTAELLLDSNTVVCNVDEVPPSDSQTARGGKALDLSDMKAAYLSLNVETRQICPAFADFEFSNWNKETDGDGVSFLDHRLSGGATDVHAFDLDAEVEPVPDTQPSDPPSELGEHRGFMDDFDHVNDDEDDEAPGGVGESAIGFSVGDGKEAQVITSAMDSLQNGTMGDLIQILASEPSDYSYFSSSLLQTWAGPGHWKLRPRSKADCTCTFMSDATSRTDGADKSKKTREKKVTFTLNYEDEVDFDSRFKQSRAATTLKKRTWDKYTNLQTTLPEDLHYDADKLFRLFARPKLMVKRQAETTNIEVEDYDYNNTNDRENFCPDLNDGGDDDDDNDVDNSGGFNFTEDGGFSQDAASQVNDPEMNATLLTGSKLVEQPRKVAKIDIDYAKTAKRMDMKKLKTSMWKILVKPEKKDEQSTSAPAAESEKTAETTSVDGAHSFKTLVNDLPHLISKTMSNNLSVPLAFVCLLHLANERSLQITNDESMEDLRIVQG